MKKVLFNELCIGDYVYDKSMEVYGKVMDNRDIHNVIIEYDSGGGGLYCLDEDCEDYDENLYLIKNK
jgi:hypothetical protein